MYIRSIWLSVNVYQLLLAFPVVCVDFTQTVYEAFEVNGFVQICVELEGELDDFLSVYLFTVPDTAQGMLFIRTTLCLLLYLHLCSSI